MNTFLKNEADVEQKFVWGLLTVASPRGLGIPPSQILVKPNIRAFEIEKREKKRRHYPDYVITIQGLPIIVVEVKPPSDSLDDASEEARMYASELNALYPPDLNPVKFSIVTNGSIVRLFQTDSDKFLVEFSSQEANEVNANFGDFLTLLSENQLEKHASAVNSRLSHEELFQPLKEIGGQTIRSEQIEFNDFGRVLSANFQAIFDPTTYDERKKIAIEAYVPSKRKERFFDEIDRIIRQSSPIVAGEAVLIENTCDPGEIIHKLQDFTSLRNRTLLLVGSVGSGKSTFVDHLRECAISEDLKKNTAWVRINLNSAPISQAEIYSWIRTRIIAGIKETSLDLDVTSFEGVQKLYAKELREFEAINSQIFEPTSTEYKVRLASEIDRLRNDQVITIKSLEHYLCSCRARLLIIVLDNCDKRDRDEQLLMFQVAKYIQEEIRCLVMLPLRHETYENHKNEPPLDTALKDLIFRIEPPQFQEVLTKRLDLVLAVAKQNGKNSLTYRAGATTVVISLDRLEKFLHSVMGSLFENRRYGRNIIVGLAGWNIRLAFEIFLNFCRSGYIDTKEIFAKQADSNAQAFLDRATVSRVLFRTHRRYYDSESSYVKNLFQSRVTDAEYYPLLRYWILMVLRTRTQKHNPKGYYSLKFLITHFLAHGVSSDRTRSEVSYLAKAGCILAEHLRAEIADDDLIAITPAGHVHIELAHKDVYYLAACAEDSWIPNKPICHSIVANMEKRPWYAAQSWKCTLENAGNLCLVMRDIQADLQLAPFSPESADSLPFLDFERHFEYIDGELARLDAIRRH